MKLPSERIFEIFKKSYSGIYNTDIEYLPKRILAIEEYLDEIYLLEEKRREELKDNLQDL